MSPNPPPPETVALVRRLYAEGWTNKAIMAATGITSVWQLYRCLDGLYPDGSEMPLPLPKVPRRRKMLGRQANKKMLVERLWRNAEQQVQQIEARMKDGGFAQNDSERDARALAVVVRTLRELSSLTDGKKETASKKPEATHDDNSLPTDIDEIRRELARRINAFVDERTGHGVPGATEE